MTSRVIAAAAGTVKIACGGGVRVWWQDRHPTSDGRRYGVVSAVRTGPPGPESPTCPTDSGRAWSTAEGREHPVIIAIPLFEQVTALDAVGPYEVLQRLPGAEVVFVGHEGGSIRTDNGFLGMDVDVVFEEMTGPDVVVFPGGWGTRRLLDDERVLSWLRAVHQTTLFTTSVCTGALVLATAGLLEGLTAATHWSAYAQLESLGAVPTGERVVEHLDRRVVTAAGVSAGIDMALRLSELLVDADAAKAMQLMIEYDPRPPFDAGSVAKAGASVLERVREYSRDRR